MQNKEVYQKLIRSIDDGVVFSMCAALEPHIYHTPLAQHEIKDAGYKGGYMEMYFPELWAQRPQANFDFTVVWFPLSKSGMQERKKCLLKAIEACK